MLLYPVNKQRVHAVNATPLAPLVYIPLKTVSLQILHCLANIHTDGVYSINTPPIAVFKCNSIYYLNIPCFVNTLISGTLQLVGGRSGA